MPSKGDLVQEVIGKGSRQKKEAEQLPPECNSEVSLFSPGAISAASFFTPGVGVAMNYCMLKHLTCAIVKGINFTSQTLATLSGEMAQL